LDFQYLNSRISTLLVFPQAFVAKNRTSLAIKNIEKDNTNTFLTTTFAV